MSDRFVGRKNVAKIMTFDMKILKSSIEKKMINDSIMLARSTDQSVRHSISAQLHRALKFGRCLFTLCCAVVLCSDDTTSTTVAQWLSCSA